MNPDDSSTEKLNDVFLDRFDLVYMNPPENLETEKQIVLKYGKRLNAEFPEQILNFAIYFVRLLREDQNIQKKPSVRATLGLYERAQANALLNNRKVTIEDIRNAVISVIAHRIELKPSVKYLKSPADYVKEQMSEAISLFKEGRLTGLPGSDSGKTEGLP